jgi:hypothetical protein
VTAAPDSSAWRGVAAEKTEEVSAGLAALLRERSRRLLGDLLRPHRRAVTATVSLIVLESLAALAGPWLVGIAIDTGLPPLLHSRDAAPLLGIAAAFAVAVAVQAVTTRMFVTMTWNCAGACSRTSSAWMWPSTRTTPPAVSSPGRPPTSTPSRTCSRRAWTR